MSSDEEKKIIYLNKYMFIHDKTDLVRLVFVFLLLVITFAIIKINF
jgi:hypothetical protein